MVDEWQRGKVARRSGGQCLGTCLGTRGPQCCDMWGTVWATSGMVWYMTGYTLASYRPLNTSNIRQGVSPCPLHSSRHPPSRGPNRQKAGCNSASSRGSKLRVDDHCKGQVSRSRKAIPSVQKQSPRTDSVCCSHPLHLYSPGLHTLVIGHTNPVSYIP